MSAERLGLIGRDYVLIRKLAEQVRTAMRREYEHTGLHETADRRGHWFEVRMVDGYVARITVVLDRIESNAAEVPADLRGLIGADVVIGTPRSMGDGALTLRWGKLVAVRDTVAVLDGFHDSAGIGAYVDGSYRHDGVEFPLRDITTIRRAR